MHYAREILGVTESPLVKIGTLAESMPGSIKLCYGESDMPTPEWISRAAYDAAVAGQTHLLHESSGLRRAPPGDRGQGAGATWRVL
jgi:hypothetical protein